MKPPINHPLDFLSGFQDGVQVARKMVESREYVKKTILGWAKKTGRRKKKTGSSGWGPLVMFVGWEKPIQI